ncbi:hypothetical protein [Actinotalea subterranea]|uniref:hypothetical protein n=1 Tax=Actinotalea subterranea TaxID=2607497 RepID=UPI0011EFABE9|nr:hypothetical protein [Actinotalea subterranea]
MLVQNVIRGIGGLVREPDNDEVEAIMRRDGLVCAALRHGFAATAGDAENLLGSRALDAHRHRHTRVADASPYVSMTAGTYVERGAHNHAASAFLTALLFATNGLERPGWLFYGYVFLLGHSAGGHAEFAEEVRDVHQHPAWSRFRAEGEIAVPVRLPPRRLLRAERYAPEDVLAAARSGSWPPAPDDVVDNRATGVYLPPERLISARAVV